MSVAIFGVMPFRRMAAVLFAAAAKDQTENAPTIDALAEVFAIASAANHAAFKATYAERAEHYLRECGSRGPLTADVLAAAITEPLDWFDASLARSDAELLIYNTIDNDGGEHLGMVECLAVERVAALIIEASVRLIRTGQCRPERVRVVRGGTSDASVVSLRDRRGL